MRNLVKLAEIESGIQESDIATLLFKIGITPGLKGYHYILSALQAIIADPAMSSGITKKLYPAIAKQCNATPSRVERAMRHAIQKAWGYQSDTVTTLFPCNDKWQHPTNLEFLGTLAEALRLGLA